MTAGNVAPAEWIIVGPVALPAHAVKYAETPVFDQDTLPKGLQGIHTTKAGAWGLATVHAGQIDYVVPGEGRVTRLQAGQAAVILPEQEHHVRLCGDVQFQVEFHRVE